MKGLFLRIIAAFALLLWAVDMVFPWQKIMQSEQNPYTAIKNRGSLIVGTINNPIYYFIGNEGESGVEYELAKNFADYLGARLQIKTLENNDQLFNELENNNIDIAAANLLFQPQRAEKFHSRRGCPGAEGHAGNPATEGRIYPCFDDSGGLDRTNRQHRRTVERIYNLSGCH